MKIYVSFVTCLATFLAFSGIVQAEAGVVFVHGSLKEADALRNYWTPAFVNSVCQGLANPENCVVVNCDIQQYMWEEGAAGCVAEHIDSFIEEKGISSLLVITHSHGGNVMRWIMSNPTYDARYPRIIETIAWVDALAPSSLGTPIADAIVAGNIFEKGIGELIGYRDMGAVITQQTSEMAYYNNHWLYGTKGRPDLPRPFEAIIGTDVEVSLLDRDSYCGGYLLNLGLQITKAWLHSCADGLINCNSQEGAGEVWFRDVNWTRQREPLSHAQSRHGCFGLDLILRKDVARLSEGK